MYVVTNLRALSLSLSDSLDVLLLPCIRLFCEQTVKYQLIFSTQICQVRRVVD